MLLLELKNQFEARMSSSAYDCEGGGGGFNMFNFMTMVVLSAQVRFTLKSKELDQVVKWLQILINIANINNSNNNNNNNVRLLENENNY